MSGPLPPFRRLPYGKQRNIFFFTLSVGSRCLPLLGVAEIRTVCVHIVYEYGHLVTSLARGCRVFTARSTNSYVTQLRLTMTSPDRCCNERNITYDMIFLLTAIGLSPGGSTHLHTNNTQNNTNNK
jgi:hypothetical protein